MSVIKLFPLILRWIANPVEPFGFTLIQSRLPLSTFDGLRDGFWKQANTLQYFHKRMIVYSKCFDSALDALGLQEQQHDSADQRERPDGGRDEMIIGGRNVHPKEINGFSRRREAQAGIGEHHNAECDQKERNDGFYVHIE